MWRRIALTYKDAAGMEAVLKALADNPVARRDKAIRGLLLTTQTGDVIRKLLADGDPAEFEYFMGCYLRVDRRAAIEYLRQNGLPAGVEPPR